jgi:HSP20 family protein
MFKMADILSPRPFDIVGNDMENLMRRFLTRSTLFTPREGFWHPPVDIHITDKFVFVRVDIPGIDPKQVDISIEDNKLLVRGKRIACEEAAKDERCWYNETSRGDFHRIIDLPEYVDGSKASANGENGVLTIKLPRKKEAKAKVIKVQTKQ